MRIACTAVLLGMMVAPALAQREPLFVVPGRPGVPVMINGIDASWGIVEGEFGLDRPGVTAPTVIYRPFLTPVPYRVHTYYPADGRRPGYGRLEIPAGPHRPLPPPAPTYYRDWFSESAPTPVTEDPHYGPVVLAPVVGGGSRRGPTPSGGSRIHP